MKVKGSFESKGSKLHEDLMQLQQDGSRLEKEIQELQQQRGNCVLEVLSFSKRVSERVNNFAPRFKKWSRKQSSAARPWLVCSNKLRNISALCRRKSMRCID